MKLNEILILLAIALALLACGTSCAGDAAQPDTVPDCAVQWYEPLISPHIQGVAPESLFVARKVEGNLWDNFPFPVTEVIYRAQRPTEHMIVVQDGTSCAVIWGPTGKHLDLSLGVDMEFPLAIERLNRFIAGSDVRPLEWTNDALVDYAFAILKIASTAWTLDPPDVILVREVSDIPGVSGATFEVQPPEIERSEKAVLVVLYTWSELMGTLNYNGVLIRHDGTVAIDRGLVERGVGEHLSVLERF